MKGTKSDWLVKIHPDDLLFGLLCNVRNDLVLDSYSNLAGSRHDLGVRSEETPIVRRFIAVLTLILL